ncbi:MAG: nucleotide exchange factor GrpE [Frankiales bacterium]|nr:nucleotide exchange factor GrpE [Frankiales bacterium]
MSSDDPIVDDPDAVTITDKRKVDPETGAVRPPTSWGPGLQGDLPVEGHVVEEDDPVAAAVAELTADLQRVSAEYANYRKRVERDRVAVVEMATAGLLSGLLPVLDDIDRARQHGDLTGAFAAVADSLAQVTVKLGLEQFGAAGEPFDPSVHEALMQAEPDPAQTVATCASVLQPGYRLAGGRVLRPARVSVAEPGQAEVEPPQQPQL